MPKKPKPKPEIKPYSTALLKRDAPALPPKLRTSDQASSDNCSEN